MAGNDWINSYLEAILDVGPGLDDAKSSLLLRERGRFSPTRYFVEQVITGFDETDLYRSWVRAAATRSPQERNTRLENMCWRIWNLARQKKQLEGEEVQRMAKRRLERERGRKEATADMSEDLSEGEKGDTVSDLSAHGDNTRGRLRRISSVETMEAWASQQKGKKLYIVLISLHGLIRGENMELGRDSDTGGQVMPPGMEFHHIVPHDGDAEGETEANEDQPASPEPPIWPEIMRFFSNPRKPMILALARPDPKKNLTTLVKAFGECRPLRELANLTLIMGNRDDVDEMSSTSASLLLSILKLIDKYDLYGQVAYPKHHKQSDVPDIYRLAAKTKGVFINPAFIEPFGLTLIEAAAYGLPIVATKNGGPVDIHRVLNNGLLIDPHDQQSIADALLKLVSDNQLWAKCRQNGLKNIHLFSWPEHCKTYLSRIASCKLRQPWWQRNDDGDENSESDSPSDSLRDISLNLKFSMDGEKNEGSYNADSSLESEDRKSKLENAVLTWSKGVQKGTQKAGFTEKADQNSSAGKFPALRRRKHIIVIAVDFDAITDLFESARKIFDSVEKERTEGSVGFILATSFTLSEIQSFLISGGLSPTDFDAFICNSGGDLYYSSPNSEDNPFVVDLYYHSHIEYRWGGEGLRKTLVRWAGSITDKTGENEEKIVTEDEKISTNYCYAFKVQKTGKVPPVKEIRKLMRIQALRCHVIYCQNGHKINVIPVLASRSEALRYLYLRWGVDLSKMVVFVGESGDTDYEGLLGGIHKSVILKGVCSSASTILHANRNYPLSDVLPFDSPNIVQTTEECSSADLRTSLEKFGLLKG
ncbi:probable sucrose-phosphate synthase 1 isoform X2 [Camellia sinensis]|uniref:probable sucrose-phosphate synthase 1 isoform X2 n=1 Tax=Camellia sinensis TaxID=4442 RepID=UPI0010361DEC|nr:probable sucrose-phosphate synthase 1 isoform X2 [Camellia sinensis]